MSNVIHGNFGKSIQEQALEIRHLISLLEEMVYLNPISHYLVADVIESVKAKHILNKPTGDGSDYILLTPEEGNTVTIHMVGRQSIERSVKKTFPYLNPVAVDKIGSPMLVDILAKLRQKTSINGLVIGNEVFVRFIDWPGLLMRFSVLDQALEYEEMIHYPENKELEK